MGYIKTRRCGCFDTRSMVPWVGAKERVLLVDHRVPLSDAILPVVADPISVFSTGPFMEFISAIPNEP